MISIPNYPDTLSEAVNPFFVELFKSWRPSKVISIGLPKILYSHINCLTSSKLFIFEKFPGYGFNLITSSNKEYTHIDEIKELIINQITRKYPTDIETQQKIFNSPELDEVVYKLIADNELDKNQFICKKRSIITSDIKYWYSYTRPQLKDNILCILDTCDLTDLESLINSYNTNPLPKGSIVLFNHNPYRNPGALSRLIGKLTEKGNQNFSLIHEVDYRGRGAGGIRTISIFKVSNIKHQETRVAINKPRTPLEERIVNLWNKHAGSSIPERTMKLYRGLRETRTGRMTVSELKQTLKKLGLL